MQNGILVGLVIGCNGEEGFDILLGIETHSHQDSESVSTGISKILPLTATAAPLLQVDKIINHCNPRVNFKLYACRLVKTVSCRSLLTKLLELHSNRLYH